MIKGDFLYFSNKVRHKIAAHLLRLCHEKQEAFKWREYRTIEQWLCLPALDAHNFQALADRYALHRHTAQMPLQEHNLLTPCIHQTDTPSTTPYLPVHIYLDNLRSAFNVGSIVRTTEAFRLGTLVFGGITPFIDNAKVQKTSMCAFDKVPCRQSSDLASLPHPLIALETLPDAPSLFDFDFPPQFTLILGNEEYGISQELLAQTHAIVRIPLHGFKNSLNVASAYACAASMISHKLRKMPT